MPLCLSRSRGLIPGKPPTKERYPKQLSNLHLPLRPVISSLNMNTQTVPSPKPLRPGPRIVRRLHLLPLASAFAFVLTLGISPVRAANLYWDTDNTTVGLGGTGTWANAGSAFWNSSVSGQNPPTGVFSAWNNANLDTANFGGTAGTVTLSGTVVANKLVFNAGGYTLQGDPLTISTPAAIFIDTATTAYSGTNTIASDIALNVTGAAATNNYSIRNQPSTATADMTISGDIVVTTTGSGSNYLGLNQGTTAGKVTLSGAVSSAVGTTLGLKFGNIGGDSNAVFVLSGSNSLNINSEIGRGTVLVENNNAFNGTSSISVGTSVATLTTDSARLLTNGAHTVAQNIFLGAGTGVSFNRIVGGNSAHNSEFSGTVTFANASTTVKLAAVASGRVDFSGLISDGSVSGSVEKIGDGVVRLTRAAGNTYDGGTTVTAGTLLLMNSTGSATGTAGVTVKANATLGGTGFATGLVTADGAAGASRFAPGDTGAIGLLNLTGGLTASTGATFDLQINGAATDQIAFGSGALSLDGNVTLNLTSLGSVVTATPYTLFTGSGTWTGVVGSGLTFNFVAPAGYSLDTTYGGGSGYVWNTATHDLSVQLVPEPATWGLLAFSLTTVLVLRRRKLR